MTSRRASFVSFPSRDHVGTASRYLSPLSGRPSEDELRDLHGWEWRLFDPLRYECGTCAVTAWRKSMGESEPLPGEDRFAFVLLIPYTLARRTFVWGGRRYRWRGKFDVSVVE